MGYLKELNSSCADKSLPVRKNKDRAKAYATLTILLLVKLWPAVTILHGVTSSLTKTLQNLEYGDMEEFEVSELLEILLLVQRENFLWLGIDGDISCFGTLCSEFVRTGDTLNGSHHFTQVTSFLSKTMQNYDYRDMEAF